MIWNIVPLLLLALASHAAVVDHSEVIGSAENEASRRLDGYGISRESLKGDAILKLEATGWPVYALQRVEVTGIWSTDDTNNFDSQLFQMQIKPSFLNEVEIDRQYGKEIDKKMPWGVRHAYSAMKALGYGKDFIDAFLKDAKLSVQETLLQETARGGESIRQLKNKEINEIVAHSWGTEIVYNAIMNGEILPPRVLFVVGPPDRNDEKWEMLARMTGTEVVIVAHTNDPINKYGGSAEKAAARLRDIGSTWHRRCFEGNHSSQSKCLRHGRIGSIAKFEEAGDKFFHKNHDRTLYYRKLKEKGYLEKSPDEMDWAQNSGISAMTESMFEQRLREMTEIVARERRNQGDIAALNRPSPAAIVSRPVSVRPEYPIRETFINLRRLALLACESPQALTDAELRKPILAMALADPEEYGNNLTGCPRFVFDELVRFAGLSRGLQPTKGWLLDRVNYFRAINTPVPAGIPRSRPEQESGTVPPGQSHDPVWDRVKPILRGR